MTAIDPAMATAIGSGRRRHAVAPATDSQAAPTALRAMMSRRLMGSAIHCSSPRMARLAKARSSVTGGVMIGLMINHAAMGSAVQLRRYQSGTTTRGVEAHLLQALMGWACLTKTQLRIEVDIPISPRVRAKDRAAATHPRNDNEEVAEASAVPHPSYCSRGLARPSMRPPMPVLDLSSIT